MSPTTLERGQTSTRRSNGEVDPRIQARRQEVERDHGRRRRSRVIGFAIVIAAIAAVVGLVQSSVLDIDRFDVVASPHVPADQLVQVSGVELHRPLALVDAEAVRARILQLPWVADASVVARWPGTLRLAVTERVPVAIVAVPEGFVLIDGDGRVLGPASAPPAPDLTGPALVEGIVVPAPGNMVDARGQLALEVLATVPSGVRTRLEAIVIGDDGEISLRLRPGMVATIGPVSDLDQKVRTLQTMLAQVVLDEIDSIDLRVAGRADVTRRTPTPPPGPTTATNPDSSGASTGRAADPTGATSAAATSGSSGATTASGSPSTPD